MKNTTKFTNKENVPRINLQRTAEIKNEYSRPYRAELVQNTPKKSDL